MFIGLQLQTDQSVEFQDKAANEAIKFIAKYIDNFDLLFVRSIIGTAEECEIIPGIYIDDDEFFENFEEGREKLQSDKLLHDKLQHSQRNEKAASVSAAKQSHEDDNWRKQREILDKLESISNSKAVKVIRSVCMSIEKASPRPISFAVKQSEEEISIVQNLLLELFELRDGDLTQVDVAHYEKSEIEDEYENNEVEDDNHLSHPPSGEALDAIEEPELVFPASPEPSWEAIYTSENWELVVDQEEPEEQANDFAAPSDVAKADAQAEAVRFPTGKFILDASYAPEMVIVGPGEFLMGSLNGHFNEKPQHRVVINYSFAVGKYPVTFAEFDYFVSSTGYDHRPDSRGWGRGNLPVVNVGWEDAQAYIQWLSEETAEDYRLLSESEWEYCCRAGTSADFWWGDDIGSNRCNGDGSGSQWSNSQPSPVGRFPSNAFGLYDTHGNVWEWVEDRFHDNYDGSPGDGSAWVSGIDEQRVVRGGSWISKSRFLRSASRGVSIDSDRDYELGFRVARKLR